MDQQRRTFLKGAGVAGGAALAGAARVLGPSPAEAAQNTASTAGLGEMPKQMTFVTIRRGSDLSLGVKTDRGILDVRRAEAALKPKAPRPSRTCCTAGPAARRR